MSISERNWVGELNLEYFSVNPRVRLEIDEVGYTLLTMDQADSLAAILRDWVEKYQQAEKQAGQDREQRRHAG